MISFPTSKASKAAPREVAAKNGASGLIRLKLGERSLLKQKNNTTCQRKEEHSRLNSKVESPLKRRKDFERSTKSLRTTNFIRFRSANGRKSWSLEPRPYSKAAPHCVMQKRWPRRIEHA